MKMERKFPKKSVFECGFDSFEFDDGFLMNIDEDLKKNKINEKQYETKKFNSKAVINEKEKEKKKETKMDYYDLPLFVEDLEESDFFDLGCDNKKKHSSEVVSDRKNEKVGSLTNFTCGLSPIQGLKPTERSNLSSSTPVRPVSGSTSKGTGKSEEGSAKNFDFDYLEADLFEDWNLSDTNKESGTRSTVTLSQALKILEAQSARESEQKEALNQSIDLLTGEIVGAMFEEPFDLPKSSNEGSSGDSVVIVEDIRAAFKPPAAQKLNFGSDKAATEKRKNFGGVCFSSDDEFDFLMQDLLEERKEVQKHTNSPNPSKTGVELLKESDLNDSMDAVLRFKKKRGKCLQVIESDTTDGSSPSPKFRRRNRTKRRDSQESLGKAFIETEAEVSDDAKVSNDETDEDGEYDKSFLDEGSYLTQDTSANMTNKYLESVKAVSVPGRFKIPAPKSYDPDAVFSQIPKESNTDYEIDSFCVDEVEEEEADADLSDLEVAEKILEMNRKKRKRKRFEKVRKIK